MTYTTVVVSDLWLAHQSRQQKAVHTSTRLSTPKVRTGCRVCKISHLKCDEQKPSCGRCQKRGTTCHYAPHTTTRSSAIKVAATANSCRLLLPAAPTTTTHHPRSPPSPISHSSTTSIRPWEAQYLDSFRHLVVPHLGHHRSDFWCRTVPRESQHDDCVRSAMLALGALGRVQERVWDDVQVVPLYKSQVDLLARDGSTGRTVLNHYYQALVHYAKAISAFRRLLTLLSSKGVERQTARSILIATVLLSQFELLQGNTDAADQIAARSVSLLCSRLMRETEGTCTTTRDRRVGSTSLIAAAFDDEGVSEASAELILKTTLNAACSALYPKSREVILALDLPFANGPAPPRADQSLEVFVRTWKRYLAVVCVWYFRLQAHMLAAQQHHQEDPCIHIYSFTVAHCHEQRALRDRLASWKVAVGARLSRTKSDLDQVTCSSSAAHDSLSNDEYIAYSEIAVEIYGSYCSVCSSFDISGKSWDGDDDAETSTSELLDQCEAVVRMGEEEQFRPSQGGSRGISAITLRDQGVIHSGAMPVVTQIAHQTRHRGLRARAIALWGRMLGNEPHWDVLGTYLASKAVHDVEEEYRDAATGDIPLSKQYTWIEGAWDERYEQFRAVLVARVSGADGMRDRRVVMIMPSKGNRRVAELKN